MVVAEKFRAERYTVIEARDGEEALELVRTHVPDALITDLQMPYMNGLELCARLAEDARTAHIPALLLTARGHIVDRSQVGATVIRRTMAKPFGV
jgi:CheY-like chemotaxis protein